jgi:7,8-dihydropterin-6-yl-methyl-4-(beta-D-ribofuranosyl)aminobenzene 5'-phosphate synthase
MHDLEGVDECEVLVLVDNVSDLLSSVPEGVTSEIANVLAAGAPELAGRCLCCAQWGLALLVRVRSGERTHTLLFDSGPEGHGVARNAERLGVDFGRVDTVVLSHGHWDHVGGMTTVLELISARQNGARVPLHANAGMFVTRAMRRPDGSLIPFAAVPSPETLEAAGARLVMADQERLLLDRLFYLSGEIPRITAFERGLPGHVRQTGDATWVDDALIMDERYLAVHIKGKGIMVFTACSHAGIINVLESARERFAPLPLYGVMGGFHLSGAASEAIIPETIAALRDFDLRMLVPGHCTGWRAIHSLVDAFGDNRVVPSAVGRRHVFRGEAR